MTVTRRRSVHLPLALLVLALSASGFSDGRARTESAETHPVTFNRDLAPIVFRTCAPCHHPGEAGPFSLLTYGDVKSHARQIADVTRKRVMPPWLPDSTESKFIDDLHLLPEEISLFQKWVEAGMLEGSPSDLPPTPRFNSGWHL